jgi:hypothetical protein
MEKQRDKAAKRLQQKQDKRDGVIAVDSDVDADGIAKPISLADFGPARNEQ